MDVHGEASKSGDRQDLSTIKKSTKPHLCEKMKKFEATLTPQEKPLYQGLIQKFEDFLNEEVEACRIKYENELKILKCEINKREKEINRLQTLIDENKTHHARETEELQKYLEAKCADLEKQFASSVVLGSQATTADSSTTETETEETTKSDVLLHQLHSTVPTSNSTDKDLIAEIDKLKSQHEQSLDEMQCKYEEQIRTLQSIIESYETKHHQHDLPSPGNTKNKEENVDEATVTTTSGESVKGDDKLHDSGTFSKAPTRGESSSVQKIVEEYDTRLQVQIALARQEIAVELEEQIQNLLSQPAIDDSHWPPELILLRERLSAKHQLEITQMQMKHKDELSRLKQDAQDAFEERDKLRGLSRSLRGVLAHLAKCVVHCEGGEGEPIDNSGLNLTANSDISVMRRNATINESFVSEVQDLIKIVEAPSLVSCISPTSIELSAPANLKNCLELLHTEASNLLQLAGEFKRKSIKSQSRKSIMSGFEEYLRAQNSQFKLEFSRSISLPSNMNIIRQNNEQQAKQKERQSLDRNSAEHVDLVTSSGLPLGESLFGIAQRSPASDYVANFIQWQERAQDILASIRAQQQQHRQQAKEDANRTTSELLQVIEEFCVEGDKVIQANKKDHDDLQAQIESADKQLKITRQFLEEQAAEREQERDEFMREIEALKASLSDKKRESLTFSKTSEKIECLESEVNILRNQYEQACSDVKKHKMELKTSIDKIFELREIISELEAQVETKTLNEDVLNAKIKKLDDFVKTQTHSNEILQHELKKLRTETESEYKQRIRILERKLEDVRPSDEQEKILKQVLEELHWIEESLDQKTKALELLNYAMTSNSCNGTEDTSGHASHSTSPSPRRSTLEEDSPVQPSPRQYSLTLETVQRIIEKLSIHTCAEEVAIKRVHDLEMQITQTLNAYVTLQRERNTLQERVTEQAQRILALRTGLEEERIRCQESQRAATHNLNIRVHDLQNRVQSLQETLNVRNKQIADFKQQSEKSKIAIDELQSKLVSSYQHSDHAVIKRLSSEIVQKDEELKKLREQVKTEMIGKVLLPELLETMLEDKTEEVVHLREQLDSKDREIKMALEQKNTFSIVYVDTESTDPDQIRHGVTRDAFTQLSLGGLEPPGDATAQKSTQIPEPREATANETKLEIVQQELEALRGELKQRDQSVLELKKDIELKNNINEDLLIKAENLTRILNEKEQKNLLVPEHFENSDMQELKEQLNKLIESITIEREDLSQDLRRTTEFFEKEISKYNAENLKLAADIKAKSELLQLYGSKISKTDLQVTELQKQIRVLKTKLEKLQNQLSLQKDELEKKLQHMGMYESQIHIPQTFVIEKGSVNYVTPQTANKTNRSVKLDPKIVRVLESEEENNLDLRHLDKISEAAYKPHAIKTSTPKSCISSANPWTEDENFIGERQLLNQVAVLRVLICIEREQNEALRKDLLTEKEYSLERQDKDLSIIKAMNSRLEVAMEREDQLRKNLDVEREKVERLAAQLQALQKESLKLKSEDFVIAKETKILRDKIKLLEAQKEDERERCIHLQNDLNRECDRHKYEMQVKRDYYKQIRRDLQSLTKDKENAQRECKHLRKKLQIKCLQIESMELKLFGAQQGGINQQPIRRENPLKENVRNI